MDQMIYQLTIKVQMVKHQLEKFRDSLIDKNKAIIQMTNLLFNDLESWDEWFELETEKLAQAFGVDQECFQNAIRQDFQRQLDLNGDVEVRFG